MTSTNSEPEFPVCLVSVESIDVLRSRERSHRSLEEMRESVASVGLKKPVTVTRKLSAEGGERFTLICGEGRLTAVRALGETLIPARVVEVSDEDAYLMHLSENIARRRYRPLELFAVLVSMKDKGVSMQNIARKTGLSESYVNDVLALLENGEERLVASVEARSIPLHIAVRIARAAPGEADKGVQDEVAAALETGLLKTNEAIEALKLYRVRSVWGKDLLDEAKENKGGRTSTSVVRIFREQMERKRALVRRNDLTERHLLAIVSGLLTLFGDEHFRTVLRAEGIRDIPTSLAHRLQKGTP